MKERLSKPIKSFPLVSFGPEITPNWSGSFTESGLAYAEIKKSVEVGDEDRAKFVGFTLVNLSTLSPIRRYIGGVGENESSPPSTTTTTNRPLPIVCELLTTAKTTEIRECAADILRNLAFDDEDTHFDTDDEEYVGNKVSAGE
ncbi:Protein CBG21315 [Caenorhabditis briggsae]|uniref:Protein CBG21315 n=1 Tax=Caenorhabditis briggsae TaxID=6238 RepID=A8XZT7_CAEBR|nr:Protein CBG21315 [Caenorhabditis briggsae]CAP38154.1 Protein CBG21315 [Caenorhabditis briggsae]